MQTPNVIELQVKDYLRILSRQRWLIACVIAACLVGSLVVTSMQTPYYRASADIFLELEQASDAVTGTTGRIDRKRGLENEIGFLNSRLVFDEVTNRLGQAPDIESVASPDRDFVTIVARAVDPEVAAEMANTYAETYLELRRRGAVEDLLATSEVVSSQVEDLDSRISTLDGQMNDELEALENAFALRQRQLDEDDPPLAIEDLLVERREVERRYDELRQPLTSQRLLFVQYLTTAQLNSDLSSGSVGRVMSEARPPAGPTSPNPVRNTALGLVLGLVCGSALAVLRHTLTDAVDENAADSGFVDGVAVVGSVPNLPRNLRSRLVTVADPSSVSAEAYRSLRTSVLFAGTTNDRRVIQVTSASPGEGKSETSTNLAVSLAQAGKRVVLIDADLRRPTLDRRLEIDRDVDGLSSVLADARVAEDCLIDLPQSPNLWFLPPGPMPSDPAALLDSDRLGELVAQLREDFQYVVVDSPPVSVVSDPLTLSQHADGVIVVARSERTKRRDLRAAISALRQVDAPLFGMVLNGIKGGRAYRYRYKYYGPRDRLDGSGDAQLEVSGREAGSDRSAGKRGRSGPLVGSGGRRK